MLIQEDHNLISIIKLDDDEPDLVSSVSAGYLGELADDAVLAREVALVQHHQTPQVRVDSSITRTDVDIS